MIDKIQKRKIIELSDDIAKFLRLLSFKLYPVNYTEEREKFFSDQYGQTYNPQFKFQDHSEELFTKKNEEELLKKLSEINLDDDLEKYFEKLIKFLTNRQEMIYSIGSVEFFDRVKILYPWELSLKEDYAHYLEAYKNHEVNKKKKVKKEQVNAKQIKEIFENFRDKNNLDFKIVLGEDTDSKNIIFSAKKHTLTIGSKVIRTKEKIKRLIVHEILTHALRSLNAQNQDLEIIKTGSLPGYMLVEEGLAVYNEDKTGTITDRSWRYCTLRYEACKREELSFSELYHYLVDYCPPKAAYRVAYRTKRGVSDTSLPGSYKKDSAYLVGYEKIKEFLESEYGQNNPDLGYEDKLKFIYSGKMGFGELVLYKSGLFTAPKTVFHYEQNYW